MASILKKANACLPNNLLEFSQVSPQFQGLLSSLPLCLQPLQLLCQQVSVLLALIPNQMAAVLSYPMDVLKSTHRPKFAFVAMLDTNWLEASAMFYRSLTAKFMTQSSQTSVLSAQRDSIPRDLSVKQFRHCAILTIPRQAPASLVLTQDLIWLTEFAWILTA